MFLRLFLFFQFSWLTLAPSSTLASILQARPGCQEKCGNLTIPYPFGIGPSENGCSRTEAGFSAYNITCKTTPSIAKPFIDAGNDMIEVTSISETEVRIKNSPAMICFDNGQFFGSDFIVSMSFTGTPFTVSYTKNSFFGVGCYSWASLWDIIGSLNVTCPSTCTTSENFIDGHCNGTGCCQSALPKGLRKFANLVYTNTSVDRFAYDPCSYSFIGEFDKYVFAVSDLIGVNFQKKGKDIPIVLDWAIGNKTCEEAQKYSSSYACQGNSTCIGSDKVLGYHCTCNQGFDGNPYLSPGCQALAIVNEGGTGSIWKESPTSRCIITPVHLLQDCCIFV